MDKPKTAPPAVEDRSGDTQKHEQHDTTGGTQGMLSDDTTAVGRGARAHASPKRISPEPQPGSDDGAMLTRIDITGGSPEKPMPRFHTRLFAATPDIVERNDEDDDNADKTTMVLVDEAVAERDGPVPSSHPETANSGDEGGNEDRNTNVVTEVGPRKGVSPSVKPRPSSPVPGARRGGPVPFMAYAVAAAVEKKQLDTRLRPGQDDPEPPHHPPSYRNTLTVNHHDQDAHASKMSLVGEIMRKDSYGHPIRAIPSTAGRYQPIGTNANDFSLLRPCEMKDYAESQSRIDLQRSAIRMAKGAEPSLAKEEEERDAGENSGKRVDEQPAADPAGARRESKDQPGFAKNLLGLMKAKKQNEGNQPASKAAGSQADAGNSGGMASTVGILTSMLKWKAKRKSTDQSSNEKYPGYLELFNRLSKELMTSVPFPLLLQIRREALPSVQNIARAYRSTLGPHHMMTVQAFAKAEALRSELQDNDVFL